MFSQTTIILGNGFDLDLGLNTSYKSFIDSLKSATIIQYTIKGRFMSR